MTPPPKAPPPRRQRQVPALDHERTVLVLQGGGALGAYQAGVYEGLAEAGVAPDWVTGVSIGAINAALIAGNPPARRVAQLRAFWDRMSQASSFTGHEAFDPLRPLVNRLTSVSTAAFGVPGFFAPRRTPPFLAAPGSPAALSLYDTRALLGTLEEFADFDLINSGAVRLSLGSVNVASGKSVYFDSTKTRITPDHVRASGALPPAFPPVEIDGELYWDGGIMSNTPLLYVAAEDYRMDALVVQVDLFSSSGAAPRDMQQVQERTKDIQYASKALLNIDLFRLQEQHRSAVARLLEKLPASLRADPDAQYLASEFSRRGAVSLVRLVNRENTGSAEFKDYDFSRATVDALWRAGLAKVRKAIAHPEWTKLTEVGNGMRIFDPAD